MQRLPRLPPRPPHSHKGSYGRVLVIAGSRAMPGAAVLAGSGALRGGAGLVTVATPDPALPLIAPVQPCATYLPCPANKNGRLARRALPLLVEAAAAADVVALGPGLGQDPDVSHVVRALIRSIERPLVLDADGLNALHGELDVLQSRGAAGRTTVLTPHPGELARLDGRTIPKVAAERVARARALATRCKAVVLLKGHRTVITDGTRVTFNRTGNTGMATGGTGDVLTGLLAALLARLPSPLPAAALAAHVHGRAGDLAVRRIGQTALIATDLLDHLGAALRPSETRG